MCPICLTVAGLAAGGAAAAKRRKAKAAPPPLGERRSEGRYESLSRNVFNGTAPMRAENQRP